MKKALLTLLAVYAAASCGGVDIENQPPIVVGFIEPIALFVGERDTIVVSDVFSDPDGDRLTYAASNSDPAGLKAELNGDILGIEGIGSTVATVTLVATDVHGAQAEFAFEVTVTPGFRDDFDSDQGWMGFTGVHSTPDIVQVSDGHLVFTISPEYIAQFALRDVGTIGPNWKISSRVTTESDRICYGIMGFTERFREGAPPSLLLSIDLDPFGGYFAAVYFATVDEWIFIDEASLPSRQNPDEYVEIAIGYTEENVFYGYAFGDFKLFEFDMDALGLPGTIPNTIEQIAVSGTPCDTGGVIRYDWIEVSIQREGL